MRIRGKSGQPTHLVCFASGAPVHFQNRARLAKSGLRFGIDHLHLFSDRDCEPDFRAAHADILNGTHGSGFWLWKPYFLLRVLKQAEPGAIVLYVDAGAYLRRAPAGLWANGNADAILFANDYVNRHWVKRDAYILANTDRAEFHDARQLDAAFMIFRAGSAAIAFVAQWLTLCCDIRAISDMPSTLGPELPGFVSHRHDQALLGLLYLREGQKLRTVVHPRGLKYHFITHHRRRSAKVPIWWWHLFHDAFFSFRRRITSHVDLR